MKKLTALLLLPVLLLCACTDTVPANEGSVTFYYPRINMVYGTDDGVIVPEMWVYPGKRPSLEEILFSYFSGPSNPELTLPFPAGTRILKYETENTVLILTMSDPFFTLEHTDRSLACACLVMTCLDLTGATEVVVRSGDGSQRMSFTAGSFVFSDTYDHIDMPLGTEPLQG